MKYLMSALLAGLVLCGGIWYGASLGLNVKQPAQQTIIKEVEPSQATASYGSFSPVQGITYYLAGAGISNTSNTVQLSSFTLPDPNKTPITMSMFGQIGYGVLEPQTSKIENISFTGVTQNPNGTAILTGVARGLSFYTPFAASSTLSLSHAGGATFILSNSAAFYGQQFLFANNVGSSTATITFSNTTPPFYYPGPGVQANGSAIATTAEFASVAYVNATAVAGAPNASPSTKGIVQIATAQQAASTTVNGSTGARLVLPSSIATDTPGTLCVGSTNGGCVVVSLLTGKISQLWLDLTASFNVSGLWTFNGGLITTASSTLNATTTAQGITNLIQPSQQYIAMSGSNAWPIAAVIATSTGNVTYGNSALASSTIGFIGFTRGNMATGSPVYVQTSGIVSGFTGLTTGSDYYLQDGGGIGMTPGTLEMYVGTAISTTQIAMEPLHSMQFVGSATFSTGASTETVVAPTYARIIVCSLSLTAGGQSNYLGGDITISRVGKTSGTIYMFNVNDGGGSSVSTNIGCSISGNTVTAAAGSTASSPQIGSGTAYFYR